MTDTMKQTGLLAPEASVARVVIEQVTPELDGGRHAVKRLRGDVVQVEVVIFKDGHDAIAARVVCAVQRQGVQ